MEKEIKFEKLKKSHKKEIIIGGLLILGIISAITLTTSRAKYRLTQSIPIVRGTVNYKPYDFQVIAMYKQKEGSTCTEDSCYDEITDRMPSSGYVINANKSYCTLNNETDTEAKLYTNSSGEHIFKNLKKSNKCYIWFNREPQGGEKLLAGITYKTETPTFTVSATTDEGVFRVSDGMYNGYSYYWRGAVTNNHVIFAEKCWRIVRINGDYTIRLIYNGTIQTGNTCLGNGANYTNVAAAGVSYLSGSAAWFLGWTYKDRYQRPSSTTSGTEKDSSAKTSIEKWYNETSGIGANSTYSLKVADGKFCNDRNTAPGYNWSSSPYDTVRFAGYDRVQKKEPTLSCPAGDVYTLKVGMLTADEAMFAGFGNSANTNCYLYSGSIIATMTPGISSYDSVDEASYSYCMVYSSTVSYATSNTKTMAARPVINLRADVSFQSGGLGTSEKPYIVAN